MFIFFLLFLIAAGVSAIITPLIALLALCLGVQDVPMPPRKNHAKPTPLLGGVGIFFSFWALVSFLLWYNPYLFTTCAPTEGITLCDAGSGGTLVTGILLAGLWLIVGGILDDKYKLPAHYQIVWPVLAALTVIAMGLGQDNITNPLYVIGLASDPLIHLNLWSMPFLGGELVLLTDVFTFAWLMILMYATKLLDGLNGLVSGIVVIGGLILFFTSLLLGQPLPAILAIILAGAYLGFLPYNFFGRIFLGESGSTLAGFLLGVLAILGPAKISITFLILGIPILDLLWVMYERAFKEKKSPFVGDSRHLHFKLLRRGLSQKRAVFVLWLVSLTLGFLGLFFQGLAHGVLVVLLLGLMVILLKFGKSVKVETTIV